MVSQLRQGQFTHNSVACLVERPTWETRAEQHSDTVLTLCQINPMNRQSHFSSRALVRTILEAPKPQGPCHIKNTTVILFHHGGGKTLRRQQNTTAGSLKHLVFLGKIHRRSPQIVNEYSDSELIGRSIFNTAGSFENAFKIGLGIGLD